MIHKRHIEITNMKSALTALEHVIVLSKPRLSVDDAEAQMDDYADHLDALVEKTKAAIRILETAE